MASRQHPALGSFWVYCSPGRLCPEIELHGMRRPGRFSPLNGAPSRGNQPKPCPRALESTFPSAHLASSRFRSRVLVPPTRHLVPQTPSQRLLRRAQPATPGLLLLGFLVLSFGRSAWSPDCVQTLFRAIGIGQQTMWGCRTKRSTCMDKTMWDVMRADREGVRGVTWG